MKTIPLAVAFCLAAFSAEAAIIQFDLIGVAGPGLLPGNEPGTVTGGTGGEFGAGISFDDVTNLLTVNVAWGSGNGFTNLTSNVTLSHIHGPTSNPNGNNGTTDFTQTAGVFVDLVRTSDSPSTGAISNQVISFPTAQNETDLLNGKFYINVHTQTNGGGEIRGFLKVVPEPGTVGLLSLGAVGLLARQRR